MEVKTSAVVLAAGQGKRMNSKVHKQYMLIQDKPVLYYALHAFEHSFVDEIILVTGKEEVEYCQETIVNRYGFQKVRAVVPGGRERYHSVYEGLKKVQGSYVFIHDGARPFLKADILERTYQCVQKEGACVAAVPVKDTVKIADERGYVSATPNRKLLWNIQTPQVFRTDLIVRAYETLMDREEVVLKQGIPITDDAMVVETFTRQPVKLIEGSYENIKITTPEDLKIAEIFLQNSSFRKSEKTC